MFKSNAIISTSFYKLPIRDKCVRVWLYAFVIVCVDRKCVICQMLFYDHFLAVQSSFVCTVYTPEKEQIYKCLRSEQWPETPCEFAL